MRQESLICLQRTFRLDAGEHLFYEEDYFPSCIFCGLDPATNEACTHDGGIWSFKEGEHCMSAEDICILCMNDLQDLTCLADIDKLYHGSN